MSPKTTHQKKNNKESKQTRGLESDNTSISPIKKFQEGPLEISKGAIFLLAAMLQSSYSINGPI